MNERDVAQVVEAAIKTGGTPLESVVDTLAAAHPTLSRATIKAAVLDYLEPWRRNPQLAGQAADALEELLKRREQSRLNEGGKE